MVGGVKKRRGIPPHLVRIGKGLPCGGGGCQIVQRGGGFVPEQGLLQKLRRPPCPGAQGALTQGGGACGRVDLQFGRQGAQRYRLLQAVRPRQHKGGLLLLDDQQKPPHALRACLHGDAAPLCRCLPQRLLLLLTLLQPERDPHHRNQ